MKKIIIISSMLLFSITCFSQNREKLEFYKSYSLAKIYRKSNQIVKGRNLVLINDSIISFRNSKTHQTESLSLNELRSLKVKSGTHLVPYTLYGIGFMSIISLTGLVKFNMDSSSETNFDSETIGLIAVGATVGALVGLATPKWKSISFPRKKTENTSFFFNPNMDFQKDYYALKLTIHF